MEEELVENIAGTGMLVFRSGVQIIAKALSEGVPLFLLLRSGSGTDNIDLDSDKQHNFKLIRVPGPGAKAGGVELLYTMVLRSHPVALARETATAIRGREMDLLAQRSSFCLVLLAQG